MADRASTAYDYIGQALIKNSEQLEKIIDKQAEFASAIAILKYQCDNLGIDITSLGSELQKKIGIDPLSNRRLDDLEKWRGFVNKNFWIILMPIFGLIIGAVIKLTFFGMGKI